MISVTRTARWWFAISGALLASSIGAISVWGLRPGIDFVGGSVMDVRGPQLTVAALEARLEELGVKDAVIQTTGDGSLLIRTHLLDTTTHAKLLQNLEKVFPNLEERQFLAVGPTISRELLRKSFLAVFLASGGILLYLAVVFRKTTAIIPSWVFGAMAIVALVHDILIATGFFAVYARFWSASADSLFVTALLTILGFSVHDTIVIFNRIKANLRMTRGTFADIVDRSVLETFTRSINTSFTTLFVLLALILFGGATIRAFLLTLAVGVIVGTYSSIFIAAPLLVTWHTRFRGRR